MSKNVDNNKLSGSNVTSNITSQRKSHQSQILSAGRFSYSTSNDKFLEEQPRYPTMGERDSRSNTVMFHDKERLLSSVEEVLDGEEGGSFVMTENRRKTSSAYEKKSS